MKKPHTQAEVDALMTATFDVRRDPRSPEYRQGARRILESLLMTKPWPMPPYRLGTCQADAYFSGQDEGRDIAHRINNEQKAQP